MDSHLFAATELKTFYGRHNIQSMLKMVEFVEFSQQYLAPHLPNSVGLVWL